MTKKTSIIDDIKISDFETEKLINNPFKILWSVKKFGFGEFAFYEDEQGELYCDNEYMSKDFIKKCLTAFVDKCKLTSDNE